MATATTRRGVYASFSVKRNDEILKKSLRILGDKGTKSLDGFMKRVIDEQVKEAKMMLKAMAGGLAKVSVPPTLGYKKSTNIHMKVAQALKNERVRSKQYRVHTGDSLADAKHGVLAQRGGRIAHIVAKGMDPFRYGNLPMLVMSSTSWYRATNARNWVSTGMRMRASHPGFYDTFDYIGFVEENSRRAFEESADSFIYALSIEAGLTPLTLRGKASMTTSIGGRGVMAARSVE